MSVGDTSHGGLRILFFGLPAGVSAAVLQGLLDEGVKVAGIAVPAASVPHLLTGDPAPIAFLKPAPATGITLMSGIAPEDTLNVAWMAGLPALAVGDFAHSDSLAALTALGADVACVACFSRRIPAAVLRLPRLGVLNLHPSLLPAFRGPTPVFWQMRDGAETGVTVHYMDDGLDTGDIAARMAVPLPDGVAEADAERMLMLAGLNLLPGVLDDLARGIVHRRPQPAGGSYFGFPSEDDFTLATEWPARRAFNFMRATAGRGMTYPVEIAGQRERLAIADHYEADLELDRSSVRHGRHILIRFNPGILYARLAR